MLPWRGGDVDGRPFGTDKPSGSLFIPPEYRSVNCHVCTASVEFASGGAPSAPVAGAMIDVVVGAAGPCELPPGVDVPDIASWHHAVSFGDGGTAIATGGSATLRHTYDSRGTYEIRRRLVFAVPVRVLAGLRIPDHLGLPDQSRHVLYGRQELPPPAAATTKYR